jgi:hypothetical protein
MIPAAFHYPKLLLPSACVLLFVGCGSREPASAGEIEIAAPREGAVVGPGRKVDVEAKVPAGCRHPTALVAPLDNMIYWVQPAGMLRSGGRFDAEVFVGEETQGCGRRFALVVVCDERGELHEGGRLEDMSRFALRSEPVVVRRECDGKPGSP